MTFYLVYYEINYFFGDVYVMGLGEGLPAGNGVDFDGVELAVFAGQEIDARERSVDGGGGAAGEFDERVVGYEWLGGRAAADISAPIELVNPAHAENAITEDE